MLPDSYKSPASLIGKTILVGVTVLDGDENVLEQFQLYGVVTQVTADGIGIERSDCDSIFNLPPDIRAFSLAEPGEYRLRSTGETIVDPDILSTWVLHALDNDRLEEIKKHGTPRWEWKDAT